MYDRDAFIEGKETWLAQLEQEGLHHASLSELKTTFCHDRLMDPEHDGSRRSGAILRAIHEFQKQQLTQRAARWVAQIERLGGSRVQPIIQNLFPAAAERLRGVCAGISAQIAASWLSEVNALVPGAVSPQPVPSLAHYLSRLTQAIESPSLESAKIFGLGLMQWCYLDAKQRYAKQILLRDNSQKTLIDAQDLSLRDSTEYAAAFELAQGPHATLLAIAGHGAERRYLLADPNFGCAQFASRAQFEQALTFQQNTLQQAFHGAPEENAMRGFWRLHQYRSDLPSLDLLPEKLTRHLAQPLRLSDLATTDDLHQRYNQGQALRHARAFQEQQYLMSVKEYQTQLYTAGELADGFPLEPALVNLLHEAESGIDYTDARIQSIEFGQNQASIFLMDLSEPIIIYDEGDIGYLRMVNAQLKKIDQHLTGYTDDDESSASDSGSSSDDEAGPSTARQTPSKRPKLSLSPKLAAFFGAGVDFDNLYLAAALSEADLAVRFEAALTGVTAAANPAVYHPGRVHHRFIDAE